MKKCPVSGQRNVLDKRSFRKLNYKSYGHHIILHQLIKYRCICFNPMNYYTTVVDADCATELSLH